MNNLLEKKELSFEFPTIPHTKNKEKKKQEYYFLAKMKRNETKRIRATNIYINF